MTGRDDAEGQNEKGGGLREALPPWKRLLDLICLAVSLPLTMPLALGLAVCIKLYSPGPVLFRQERVGYRGRRFMLLKFRTMKVAADAAGHQAYLQKLQRTDAPMTKLDDKGDARLIHCGRILRASGLDELPQLINVLRGEMSLVGPRPCLPYEYEIYTESQKRRFESVPGLTGLWQVSGKNATTFNQMIELDALYARRKSPWLDLWVMARTPWVLAHQLMATRRAPRVGAVQPLEKATP